MEVEDVEVDVAYAMWRAGDLFVDVRTPEEYARGHIPDAVNVPVDRIAFSLASLPAGQLVTVCSTGVRSRRAAETLARLGRPAFSLRGGTKAWAAAGHRLDTGDRPTRPERGRFERLLRRLRTFVNGSRR